MKKINFNTNQNNTNQKLKICVLGYGIENQALVNFLISKKIPGEITICDAKDKVKAPGRPVPQALMKKQKNLKWRLGKDYDKNLTEFDIIFRVAGYPLFAPAIKKAIKAGVRIGSPIKLFFDLRPTKNIIGVTGTKGKGTTASLIYAMLKQAGKRAFLGGNIGTPVLSFMEKIKKNDWVVLELSSFQLEDLKKSPKIAVITNFYKDHLTAADPSNPNYHKNLSLYWQAKSNIFQWQKRGDKLIINERLKQKIKKYKIKSDLTYFSKSNLASQMIGEHNKENIAAAVATAKTINLPDKVIAKTVKNFQGLAHRLEPAGEKGKIKYYDDSFSTTPENTIAALKSFADPIILLAGGADKGSDFKPLAKIIKNKVKFIILFSGQAMPRLKRAIREENYPKQKIKTVKSMAEAIAIAREQATPDNIVLLSPGCASFGLFKNYKERGNLFKKEVKNKI